MGTRPMIDKILAGPCRATPSNCDSKLLLSMSLTLPELLDLNTGPSERPYSMISSALESKVSGKVIPSDLAVFMLMIKSNLFGCWMGS
jgi:hypothetical protein